MSLHVSVILSMGGGGIPACTTGHMTKHYISTCTGDQSQLVTGQHAGNIKCMMGWVTWYTLPGAGTPLERAPPRADTPQEQTPLPGADPLGADTPQSRHPQEQTPLQEQTSPHNAKGPQSKVLVFRLK